MHYVRLTLGLISIAALGGCGEGVLDPKGPISIAEREILFNATGVMLAIVIPTMLATLGVAFWFRASNDRAEYLPDFQYSGRIELLVWSDPADDCASCRCCRLDGALTILTRLSRLPPPRSRSRIQVVSLDWKWLFIYPDEGIATVNQADDSRRRLMSFELTSSGVMNSFFVASARGSDLYHGGDGDEFEPASRPSRRVSRHVSEFQRRWVCRHAL